MILFQRHDNSTHQVLLKHMEMSSMIRPHGVAVCSFQLYQARNIILEVMNPVIQSCSPVHWIDTALHCPDKMCHNISWGSTELTDGPHT